MIIEVDEHGELKIDSALKSIEDFNQDFLESLVKDSLAGKVKYQIEGATPIAKFFNAIDEGTRPGSDLKKLQEEVTKMKTAPSNQDNEDSENVDESTPDDANVSVDNSSKID